MTTTTMLFGPEWMRPKHPARQQNPPSPPPNVNTTASITSSYSSLVATTQSAVQDSPDPSDPFLYSKDEMLRIYKEGGGRGGLGLEVERWEGVVREVGNEPASLKDWTEAERKLFSGSLNSEIRRRQSSDYLSLLAPTGERPKLNGSSAASPMRERFNLLAKRRDSSDQSSTVAPRKLSLNANQSPFGQARDASIQSPRTRGPLTPGGIDGVLSGGDTWVSRRRASETGKNLAAALRGSGDPSDGRGLKIAEEDEDAGSASNNWRSSVRDRSGADGNESKKQAADEIEAAQQAISSAVANMAGLALKDDGVVDRALNAAPGDGGSVPPALHTPSAPARPPGLPVDLASVEWSYLDPQGQVQGPFRADLMQNWSSQGYFAPDLLVKRATIDVEWSPVGSLMQRLGTENIFMTAFDPTTATLPVLPQASDLPSDATIGHDTPSFRVPYQPIPTRTSQISALESYYNANSPNSHSPASSFGAGRFGNGTPDPSQFVGRLGNHMADSPIAPRGGFAPDTYGGRRQAFGDQSYNDPQFDPSYNRGPYSSFGPARAPSADDYGFGSQPRGYSSQVPWNAVEQNGLTNIRTNTLDPFIPHVQDPGYASASPLRGHPTSQSQDSFSQREFSRPVASSAAMPDPSLFDASQQYAPSPSVAYASAAGTSASPSRVASTSSFTGNSQTSWAMTTDTQSVPKRTGALPFDHTSFPTSRNTITLIDRDTIPPPAWATTSQTQVPPKTPTTIDGTSSRYNASGAIDDGWRQIEGPSSLTVSNLGQHNQQQAQEEAFAAAAAAGASAPTLLEPIVRPEPTKEEVAPIIEPTVHAQPKIKRKISTAPASTPTSVPAPGPSPVPTPAAASAAVSTSTPAESAPAKPVWSTDDDGKRGAAMSLREIQEAEARKAAERKAVERVARAAQTQVDETLVQPFTASWGLPTSQAGAATRGTISIAPAPVKDASSTAPGPSPSTPVWANGKSTASAAKKTMKEIQEEERRKAREAKEVSTGGVKRGYADTTTKVTPTVPVGGAWTTVGSNGKTTPIASSPGSRPPVPAAVVVATAATPAPSTRKPGTAPAPKPAQKLALAPPKVDDTPVAPSPEFMKWLSETLRALSNSVSYDDIVSMLLSFPLDVDASTQELISDLIYANSTTLDGRRFAADFVTRRKADAIGRKGAKSGLSIADVVKAQAKPAPGNEWGAFKVVNKKKKGGKT